MIQSLDKLIPKATTLLVRPELPEGFDRRMKLAREIIQDHYRYDDRCTAIWTDKEGKQKQEPVTLFLARAVVLIKHRCARKGICFVGEVGRGKTEALRILCELTKTPLVFAPKIARAYHDNQGIIEDVGNMQVLDDSPQIGTFQERGKLVPIAIDDLGRESEIVHYGERPNPLRDILFLRDLHYVERGLYTHMTSNYLKRWTEFYSDHIDDRIHGMCQIVRLDGAVSSRRK
jgi:hypothetical protein